MRLCTSEVSKRAPSTSTVLLRTAQDKLRKHLRHCCACAARTGRPDVGNSTGVSASQYSSTIPYFPQSLVLRQYSIHLTLKDRPYYVLCMQYTRRHCS